MSNDKYEFSMCADLGGSGTRGRVDQKMDEPPIIFNSFVKRIDTTDRQYRDFGDFDDFVIEEAPDTLKEIEGRYARGELSKKFSGKDLFTSNTADKTKEAVTYINMTDLVAQALMSNGFPGHSAGTKYHKVFLGVVIPPMEYDGIGALTFKNTAAGRYKVTYPLLDKSICFELSREGIPVGPEDAIAIFDVEASAVDLDNSIGLGIGFGSRSLDIFLLKNKRLFGKAKSLPNAGIDLEEEVSSLLYKSGYSVSKESVTSAIINGIIVYEGEDVHVGKLVTIAKENIFSKVNRDVQALITNNNLHKSDISYVFAVGRVFENPKEGNVEAQTGDFVDIIKEQLGTKSRTVTPSSHELGSVNGMAKMLGFHIKKEKTPQAVLD